MVIFRVCSSACFFQFVVVEQQDFFLFHLQEKETKDAEKKKRLQ
jgi:hypothetical protein